MSAAKKRFLPAVSILIGLCLFLSAGVSFAKDWPPPKPKMLTIATFDIGGSLYVTFSAIANAVKEKFGVKVRNVPIGNAVARAIATRSGAAMMWGSCSAYYACSEGIFDFATLQWGPQDLRAIYLCNRQHNFSPATTQKSGIKTMADVRGKRVPWIIGNPTVNLQLEAFLAFAGLTKKDVKLVDFPGYTASTRGLLSGKVDMALMGAASTRSREIESSPNGLYWIPIPHANKKGWAALQKIAPFVSPIVVREGSGVTPDKPVEVGSYACPVLLSWKGQKEAIDYWTTKMFAESWPLYKDKFLAAPYFEINESLKPSPMIPYSDGSVRYFKERNVWTPAMEKRRKDLLFRKKVLLKAFESAKDEFMDSGLKSKQFPKFWMKKRAESLKKAGLPVL